MKKRLLITSIVMMLVVAVALSTATYAWFTSNSSVTANSITLTAASNQAPSLGISWYDGNYGTTITAVYPQAEDPEEDNYQVFRPAAPTELTIGTTTSAVDFKTALATPVNNGGMVFAANGAASDVYTWTDGTYTSFFLKNLSPSNSIGSVTVTATISGAGEALVRVGVFKWDQTASAYKLLGVLAKQEANTYTQLTSATTMDSSTTYYKLYLGKYVPAVIGEEEDVTGDDPTADYYNGMTATTDFYTVAATASNAKACYGTITANQPVNNMSALECATSITVASTLTAGSNVELVVKVWEDAVALGDAQSGQAANIALNFTAA